MAQDFDATLRVPFRKLTRIRWGWVLAIALGCFLGLLLATWLGETGARLGPPDQFDLTGR